MKEEIPIILMYFLKVVYSLLNLQTGENTQHIYDCVISVIASNFLPSQSITVSTSSEIHHIHHLLQRLHLREHWSFMVSHPQNYMSELDNKNNDYLINYVIILDIHKTGNEILLNLRENIEQLQRIASWNQSGKFIVVLINSVNEQSSKLTIKIILDELWKNKVNDVVILIQVNHDIVDIYSWFPYELPSGMCGVLQEAVLLDSWNYHSTGGFFTQNKTLFHNKIPTIITGCPLRVSTAHFPPYVIFNFDPLHSFSMTGLDVRMVQVIAETMDMLLELIPIPDSYPWGKVVNGKWGGLRGKLINDEADIAIAGWSNNLRDHLLLQDTERYFTEGVTWYVPRAKSNPRWLSLVRVFASSTWIIFFISIFISAIISWLLVYPAINYEDYLHFNSKLLCILNSWAVVLGVSVSELPHGNSLRLYFVSWIIYSFSINNVFQAFFTSYLIDPGVEHQIDNLEELVESNLKIVLSVFLAYFFDEQLLTDPTRRTVVDTPEEGFELALNMSEASTMLGRTFVWSKIYLENTTFSLYGFREDVINNHIVMIVQKGSPFLYRINKIILHLVEGGLPTKFMTDLANMKQSIATTDQEYVPMSTSHLQSAFIFLALGIGISIFSFSVEILIQIIRKNVQSMKKFKQTKTSICFRHNVYILSKKKDHMQLSSSHKNKLNI